MTRGERESGRKPGHKQPTAGGRDRQSVKSTESAGVRGDDAGKPVTGRKRQLLVDTLGVVLAGVVTVASGSEPAGVRLWLRRLGGAGKKLRGIWGDGAYRGPWLEGVAAHGWFRLPPGLRSDSQKGLVVRPRRWIVERPWAWLNQ